MDKQSVHQKHPNHANKANNKKKKNKKQPIKVVYISNPMKVTLTADNFRARVQELTGRDSTVAEADVAGFAGTADDRTSPAAVPAASGPGVDRGDDEYAFGGAVQPYDQMFDEAFGAPQVLGNFSGLYYESHVGGGFSEHR